MVKASTDKPFWPRLTKQSQKLNFVKIDFSKWVDEDESEPSSGPGANGMDFSQFGDMGGMGGMGGMDFSQFGNNNDDYNFDNEEEGVDEDEDEETLEPLDAQVKKMQELETEEHAIEN
jgi:hypothetical protein